MKRVVVITGVGKGFGKELLKSLCKDYYVIGISRTSEDIESLEKETAKSSQNIVLKCLDVSDFDKTRMVLSEELEKLQNPVYALINNAGVRCRKAFTELTVTDFLDVAKVNLFASINLSSILIKFMLKEKVGRIINISSILSQSALPELSAYSVSKGGLDAFTRSLAVEYGDKNISVNSILPGFCKTSYYPTFAKNHELLSMTLRNIPMNRWGEDNELVGLCKFLLSSEAGYINGASIPVDGGWLA